MKNEIPKAFQSGIINNIYTATDDIIKHTCTHICTDTHTPLSQVQPYAKEPLSKHKKDALRRSKAFPPLHWSGGPPAPPMLHGNRGSAVMDGNRAFFSAVDKVFSYSSSTHRWTEMPKCSQSYFSLAVVREQLVAVGGVRWRQSCREVTNTLVGLTHCKTWDDILPPMPTARAFPATAMTSGHLVVAGGKSAPDSKGLATVESLDLLSQQWNTARRLTVPIAHPQLVVCRDFVYTLDTDNSQVHSCSINDVIVPTPCVELTGSSCIIDDTLPSTSQCQKAVSQSTNCKTKDSTTWTQICAVPSKEGSSILVDGEQVLALGGQDHKCRPLRAVVGYDQESNTWRHVGDLAVPKWGFLAVILPKRKIMVVGGSVNTEENCDRTDIASLTF